MSCLHNTWKPTPGEVGVYQCADCKTYGRRLLKTGQIRPQTTNPIKGEGPGWLPRPETLLGGRQVSELPPEPSETIPDPRYLKSTDEHLLRRAPKKRDL